MSKLLIFLKGSIFVSFMLVWPVLFMFSAMMFDAPGNEKTWSPWITVLCITVYPIIFGLSYYFLKGDFLYVNRAIVAAVCVLIPIVSFILMYGKMFMTFIFK